jgi:hypothetical protein
MKKLKHSEAEKMLMEYLERKHSEFIKHREIKAIVSHFLQSPQICPPFMSKEIHNESLDLFARHFEKL